MKNENDLFEKRREKLSELVAQYETQEEFARAIGKDKSYVSRMLYPPEKKGHKRIGDKMVLAIQASLGLPHGWLDGITGTDIPAPLPSKNYKVEILDIEASAGPGVMVIDDFIETITSIEYTLEEAKRLFGGRPAQTIKMITVKGDSMNETFEPRDQIFVDITVDHFDGDGIYVFILNNQLYIKRLQMQYKRLAVISDNEKYETWYLEEDCMDGMFIQAKVLVCQSIKYKFLG